MKHFLRFRIVATKDDNPWLPDDLSGRNSIIKCNLSGRLAQRDPAEEALEDAGYLMRALIHRIEQVEELS